MVQTKKKCLVCESKYKEKIEELFQKGLRLKDIVDELKNSKIFGLEHGHLNHHFTYHFKDRDLVKSREETAKMGKLNDDKRKKKYYDKNDETKEQRDTKATSEIATQTNDQIVPPQQFEEKKEITTKLKDMNKDLNIIEEVVDLVHIQKGRVQKAREEEDNAGIMLGITSKIISDYQKILESAHEITKGMESLKEVRLAEIAQMFIGMVARHEIHDSTRFDLFRLLKGFETHNPDLSLPAKNKAQEKFFAENAKAPSLASINKKIEEEKKKVEDLNPKKVMKEKAKEQEQIKPTKKEKPLVVPHSK
jgi:hypothetical protein